MTLYFDFGPAIQFYEDMANIWKNVEFFFFFQTDVTLSRWPSLPYLSALAAMASHPDHLPVLNRRSPLRNDLELITSYVNKTGRQINDNVTELKELEKSVNAKYAKVYLVWNFRYSKDHCL